MKISIENIQWDHENESNDLPTELEIEIDDNIAIVDLDNYIIELLTQEYNFCVYTLEYK